MVKLTAGHQVPRIFREQEAISNKSIAFLCGFKTICIEYIVRHTPTPWHFDISVTTPNDIINSNLL